MYFITTKRMLEVCFFQHTPTFIIEPEIFAGQLFSCPIFSREDEDRRRRPRSARECAEAHSFEQERKSRRKLLKAKRMPGQTRRTGYKKSCAGYKNFLWDQQRRTACFLTENPV